MSISMEQLNVCLWRSNLTKAWADTRLALGKGIFYLSFIGILALCSNLFPENPFTITASSFFVLSFITSGATLYLNADHIEDILHERKTHSCLLRVLDVSVAVFMLLGLLSMRMNCDPQVLQILKHFVGL